VTSRLRSGVIVLGVSEWVKRLANANLGQGVDAFYHIRHSQEQGTAR